HTRLQGDWSSDVCSSDLRQIFRSTGTKEIAAAKRIAAQIIQSFWNDAGRGAEPLKLRNENAKSASYSSDTSEPPLSVPAPYSAKIGRASCRERAKIPVVR